MNIKERILETLKKSLNRWGIDTLSLGAYLSVM